MRHATYVTNLSRATLCVTTATLHVNNVCNRKLWLNPQSTSIHNLRGNDSHLLMQAISKVEDKVSCIPNNTEKYISFSLGQLRFIDSAQFLLASLDKLLAANPPGAFQITAQHKSRKENPQKLTQLSSRSHPRHLVGKKRQHKKTPS